MILIVDVIAFFTNIPEEDGVNAVRETLKQNRNNDINIEFILRLLKFIIKNNLVEFHLEYYIQEIGAAMGLPPVPPYANMFMAKKIYPKFLEIAKRFSKNDQSPMEYLKRFLDDFISLWNGTSKDLHAFFEESNKIHPHI